MNRLIQSIVSALALFLITGCEENKSATAPPPAAPTADRRAELGKELGELMTSFGKTVLSVSDAQSWAKAQGELLDIEQRIKAASEELKTLPAPTDEQRTAFQADMKANEKNLEVLLGDKKAFLEKLPPEISQELMTKAGDFSFTMGEAQSALYGMNQLQAPGKPLVPSKP